jgi:hypothetical protein
MLTHTVCLVCFFLLQLMERFRRLQVEASIVVPLEVAGVPIEDGSDKAGKGGCSGVGGKVGTGACLQGGQTLSGKGGRGKGGVEKATRAGKDEGGSIVTKSSPSTSKAPKGKATKGAKEGKGKIASTPLAAQSATPSLTLSFAINLASATKSPTVESISTTNLLGAGTSSSERVVAGYLCLVGLLVGFTVA